MFEDGPLWIYDKEKQRLKYKDAENIKKEYESLYQRLFKDINIAPYTPQGQLINAYTERDLNILASIEDLVNYFFYGGSGYMLDIWAFNMFRAVRNKAINGHATIKIEGVPFTTIEAGFKVSDGKLNYVLEKPISLNKLGEASATFVNELVTNETSLSGTINQIITPLLGIERVTNENASIAGILRENDTYFFMRCMQYGSLLVNGTFKSILANIAQLNGVIKISGYENYTNEEVVYKGTTFDAHSIGIVVLGGDDFDIAKKISETKPTGVGLMGDISIEVPTFGIEKLTYKFFRTKDVKIRLSIDVKLNLQSPQNYEETIKNALNEYIPTLEIGSTISQPLIAGLLSKYALGFEIINIKLAKGDEAYGYSPINLEFLENAIIENKNIVVNNV